MELGLLHRQPAEPARWGHTRRPCARATATAWRSSLRRGRASAACAPDQVRRPAAEQAGYVPHIRRIGEEKLDAAGEKRRPARRWVVERTLAWLQKCRAILIRYDKKAANYLGLIQLACALLWYRRLHRLKQAGTF